MLLQWLAARRDILVSVWHTRIGKAVLLVWAAISTWDTVGAQLLSPNWRQKWPTIYDMVAMTSGFFPFWVWLLVGAALLVALSLEYGLYHKRKAEVAGIEIGRPALSQNVPLQTNAPSEGPSFDFSHWNAVERFTLLQAACLWAGIEPLRFPRDVKRNPKASARYQMLMEAVERQELSAHLPGSINLNGQRASVSLPGHHTPDMWVYRKDLVRLADRLGEKPAFLFSKSRESSSPL